jgi:AcrR family transcriptional regulator
MAAPRTSAQPRPRTIRGLDADQRRAQRREQLLAAALELFARDGYANASIEEICQTAYVGNKTFYDLFDKEDCYLALLRQVSERIESQVAQAMQESADADEDELVRRLLSPFAHPLVDDPRVAMVTIGEAAGISPRVEAQRRENRRWAASFIESLWRRNHPSGGVDYDLVSDLTTFRSVVEAGIRASGR